jgi:hypothetical protein
MVDVNNRVLVRFKGEPYFGTVKQIKFGLAYVDFDGKRKNDWIELRRLERHNAIRDTDK